MKKKTFTIGTAKEPRFTLAYGHITATEFNKQLSAEGQSGPGLWIPRSYLTHEYWQKWKDRTRWKRSKKGVKGAVKVTVMEW